MLKLIMINEPLHVCVCLTRICVFVCGPRPKQTRLLAIALMVRLDYCYEGVDLNLGWPRRGGGAGRAKSAKISAARKQRFLRSITRF